MAAAKRKGRPFLPQCFWAPLPQELASFRWEAAAARRLMGHVVPAESRCGGGVGLGWPWCSLRCCLAPAPQDSGLSGSGHPRRESEERPRQPSGRDRPAAGKRQVGGGAPVAGALRGGASVSVWRRRVRLAQCRPPTRDVAAGLRCGAAPSPPGWAQEDGPRGGPLASGHGPGRPVGRVRCRGFGGPARRDFALQRTPGKGERAARRFSISLPFLPAALVPGLPRQNHSFFERQNMYLPRPGWQVRVFRKETARKYWRFALRS